MISPNEAMRLELRFCLLYDVERDLLAIAIFLV